jgi:hypothetical protein
LVGPKPESISQQRHQALARNNGQLLPNSPIPKKDVRVGIEASVTPQTRQQTDFIVTLNGAEHFRVGVTISAGMWYMK